MMAVLHSIAGCGVYGLLCLNVAHSTFTWLQGDKRSPRYTKQQVAQTTKSPAMPGFLLSSFHHAMRDARYRTIR
jgi:hypothetical protein